MGNEQSQQGGRTVPPSLPPGYNAPQPATFPSLPPQVQSTSPYSSGGQPSVAYSSYPAQPQYPEHQQVMPQQYPVQYAPQPFPHQPPMQHPYMLSQQPLAYGAPQGYPQQYATPQRSVPITVASSSPHVGAGRSAPGQREMVVCKRCQSTHVGCAGSVRFRCIHCPTVLSLCERCEETEWKSPSVAQHERKHVFLVVGSRCKQKSPSFVPETALTSFIGNLKRDKIHHLLKAEPFTCNGCKLEIQTGVQYKCANCPIKLCSACWPRTPPHNKGHCFIKYRYITPEMLAQAAKQEFIPEPSSSVDSSGTGSGNGENVEDGWELVGAEKTDLSLKEENLPLPQPLTPKSSSHVPAAEEQHFALTQSCDADRNLTNYVTPSGSTDGTSSSAYYGQGSSFDANEYGNHLLAENCGVIPEAEHTPYGLYETDDLGYENSYCNQPTAHDQSDSNLSIFTDLGYAAKDSSLKETGIGSNTARDWNSEWQTVLRGSFRTLDDKIENLQRVNHLIHEFETCAVAFGKTIIDEIFVEPSRKTIKPIDIGGEAGGEKYIHQNIFFKFAIDVHQFYGGHELAAKAASHELKGLRAYIQFIRDTEEQCLNTPVMILIDYRGYRLAASSCVPIGKGTLKYGSDDGGRTVHADDAELNDVMARAAKHIGMKPHLVGVGGQQREICGPCDIEGHRGRDGKMYVVDTARLFSPEKPSRVFLALLILHKASKDSSGIQEVELPIDGWKEAVVPYVGVSFRKVPFVGGFMVCQATGNPNYQASVLANQKILGDAVLLPDGFHGKRLYNLFRPEFAKLYPVHLSSDSFTGFGRHNAAEHHAEVREATTHLVSNLVPSIAQKLDSHIVVPAHSYQIVRSMHDAGINARYLGVVRSHSRNQRVRSLLAVEIVARAIKHIIREVMRRCRSPHDLFEDVTRHLNSIFGNSHQSTVYWNLSVKVQILEKFGGYNCSIWTEKESQNLKGLVPLRLLLHLLQQSLGIRLHERVFRYDFSSENPFEGNDIIEFIPKIKRVEEKESLLLLMASRVRNLRLSASEKNLNLSSLHRLELHQRLEDSRVAANSFGEESLEAASFIIQAASVAQEQGDESMTEDLINRAQAVVKDKTLPMELCASIHYLRALLLRPSNPLLAEQELRTALFCLELCPPARNGPLVPPHPFALIVSNLLVEMQVERGQEKDLEEICLKFLDLWKECPMVGDREFQQEVFKRDVPFPLAICFEQDTKLRNTVAKMNTLTEEQHRVSSQNWLQQINLFDWLPLLTSSPQIEYAPTLPPSGGGKQKQLRNIVFSRYVEVVLGQKIEIEYLTERSDPTWLSYLELHRVDTERFDPKLDLRPQLKTPIAKFNIAFAPGQRAGRGKWLIDTTKLSRGGEYDVLLVTTNPENNGRSVLTNFKFSLFENSLPSRMTYEYDPKAQTYLAIYPLKGIVVSSIAMGVYHGRAYSVVATDGGVMSWGAGTEGQLGHGDELDRSFPCMIKALAGRQVVSVSCPTESSSPPHVVAVTNRGDLYSWGHGAHGKLGHGNKTTRLVPRVVQALEGFGVTNSRCGIGFTIALTRTGRLFAWGRIGESNSGNDECVLFPKEILIDQEEPAAQNECAEGYDELDEDDDAACKSIEFECIAAGSNFFLAISTDGLVWLWGDPCQEQTQQAVSLRPRLLVALRDQRARSISCGSHHASIITEAGRAFIVGLGGDGQLGNGDFSDAPPVSSLPMLEEKLRTGTLTRKSVLAHGPKLRSLELSRQTRVMEVQCGGRTTACFTAQGRCFVWGGGRVLPREIVLLRHKRFANLISVSDSSMMIHISGTKTPTPSSNPLTANAALWDDPGVMAMLQQLSNAESLSSPQLSSSSSNLLSPVLQRSTGDDTGEFDLVSWLSSLNLQEYEDIFVDNAFDDEEVIRNLTDEDLKEAGITRIGHRRKILVNAVKL